VQIYGQPAARQPDEIVVNQVGKDQVVGYLSTAEGGRAPLAVHNRLAGVYRRVTVGVNGGWGRRFRPLFFLFAERWAVPRAKL